MRRLVSLALLASLLPLGAEAQTASHQRRAHVQRLPPVSGVISIAPPGIRRGAPSRAAYRFTGPRAAPLPRVIAGGIWPRQARAVYGGEASPMTSAGRWVTGGTGLRGLIGNIGNPFAGQARWGTADSATSEPGFSSGWTQSGETPLIFRYSEPALLPTAYDVPISGAAPQLGYYASGAPSTMGYYSSGSSAGPYGSPGGLATYRTGSYGYGPRIVTIPAGTTVRRNCACGPRIIRLGRRHHAVMID